MFMYETFGHIAQNRRKVGIVTSLVERSKEIDANGELFCRLVPVFDLDVVNAYVLSAATLFQLFGIEYFLTLSSFKLIAIAQQTDQPMGI